MATATKERKRKETKNGQGVDGVDSDDLGRMKAGADALADKVLVETDTKKRDAMILEATKIYTEDYAYIPLHQQALIWAARKNIELVQTGDNYFQLRWVQVK